MHNTRDWRHHTAIWIGLAALGGLLGWTVNVRADRLPPDPVDDLRQALKAPVFDATRNPDELRFRDENLTKRVNALKTVVDFRRALMLNDWLIDDQDLNVRELDRRKRAEVAKRFEDTVRAAMEGGREAEQIAAAKLLAEIGINIRGADAVSSLTRALAPDLAKLIQKGSPAVKEAAAVSLGSVNPDPKPAAAALGQLLRSDDARLRRAAADGLKGIIQVIIQIHPAKGKRSSGVEASRPDVVDVVTAVVPAVAPGLADRDAEVRRLSADAIYQAAVANSELVLEPTKTQRFPPAGRKLTDDEKSLILAYREGIEKEREEIVSMGVALGATGPALAGVMEDPDVGTRIMARKALEEMAHIRAKVMRRAASVPFDVLGMKAPTFADDAIVKAMRTSLEPLARGVYDSDLEVRRATLDCLEMFDAESTKAGTALVTALGDANRFVRWAAARTVSKIPPVEVEATVPALVRMLDEADLDLRIAAATALDHFGPLAKASVPALVKSTVRGDGEIRIAALHALESIGADAESALPAIIDALKQPDARVRQNAAEVLAHFGSLARNAESALRQALSDPDPEVRRAASESLLAISGASNKAK
jgi:HEAT repeat protein